MMLLAVLKAERIKLRRTFLIQSTWIFPLIAIALVFAIAAHPGPSPLGRGAWGIWVLGNLGIWTHFLLIIHAAIIGLLLFSTEHIQSQWKHVYTQPIPRWMWMLGKHVTLMVIMLITHVFLFIFFVISTKIFCAMKSMEALAIIPWKELFIIFAGVYIMALPLALIGAIVSARKANPALTIGLAILGLSFGILLRETPQADFYPWTMPSQWLGRSIQLISESPDWHLFKSSVAHLFIWGIVLSICLVLLACAMDRHREIV